MLRGTRGKPPLREPFNRCFSTCIANRLLQKWVTLVPPTLIKGNSRNYFPSIATTVPVLSVKLNNYPDGGIAR